jgi:hypothetical protein
MSSPRMSTLVAVALRGGCGAWPVRGGRTRGARQGCCQVGLAVSVAAGLGMSVGVAVAVGVVVAVAVGVVVAVAVGVAVCAGVLVDCIAVAVGGSTVLVGLTAVLVGDGLAPGSGVAQLENLKEPAQVPHSDPARAYSSKCQMVQPSGSTTSPAKSP